MSYGGPPQCDPYSGGPPGGRAGYVPPPGQFNQGPLAPQQAGFPPLGWYGGPPQGQYQYPPPHIGFDGRPAGQFPPHHQGSFGGSQGQFSPQQGGFGSPPPLGLPSPGYDPHAAAHGDSSQDADALRAAMKGFGTDENVLIRILSKPDPLQMSQLRTTYSARIQRNLEHDVASEVSGPFKEGLVALVRGPLMQDVSLSSIPSWRV
jgi:annexin A7/11